MIGPNMKVLGKFVSGNEVIFEESDTVHMQVSRSNKQLG